MSEYEKYQLQWMIEHGYSLRNLIDELTEMQFSDPEDSDRVSTPISELFGEWIADVGFGSEIWACEAEWHGYEGVSKMYYFYMVIGDRSGDWHGQCEYFRIESNFPVERIREVHFQIKESTDIDIEGICSEYQEDEIDTGTVQKLKNLGFQFDNRSGMGDGILCSSEEMAQLWVFLLQKTDTELRLKILNDELPTLHFCGFDTQKQHIGFVGYGLFSQN